MTNDERAILAVVTVLMIASPVMYCAGYAAGRVADNDIDRVGVWFEEIRSNKSKLFVEHQVYANFSLMEYSVHIQRHGRGIFGDGGWSNYQFQNIPAGIPITIRGYFAIDLNLTYLDYLTNSGNYDAAMTYYHEHVFTATRTIHLQIGGMHNMTTTTPYGIIGYRIEVAKMGTVWWNSWIREGD